MKAVKSKEKEKCAFFFVDRATTEVYTLALLNAFPFLKMGGGLFTPARFFFCVMGGERKNRRVNSRHSANAVGVFRANN